jgi:putative ABC transport system permease protein
VDDFREWLVKRNFRVRLLLLSGALALILLIACTNVASLLLARSSARARELALRVALGATPGRIVRQLLIESTMLSVSGGLLGLVLARALIGTAPLLLPATAIPTGVPLELSLVVLGFTLAISLITGLVFGLVPAFSASHTDIQETLKDSSRGSTGGRVRNVFREGMVVMEVAVALTLVCSAALMIESIRKMGMLDPGFRMDNVLTSRIFLPAARYDASRALDFHRRALQQIAALPGVESVGVGTNLPLMRFTEEVPFDLESSPPREQSERPGVAYIGASPDYMKALGIPLKRGRLFAESDNQMSAPVVIVNEAFANRYFPNQNPVGQRILLNRPLLGKNDFEDTIHPEIVGVIGDVKLAQLDADPVPILYAAHAQNVWSTATWFAIRTSLDPAGLTAAVRRQILELDKDIPVEQASSMEQLYSNQFAEPRFQSQLMAAFALLSMVVAVVGIYGVNAYAVAQRGREIAVRVALGATSGSILASVLGRGLKLALLGVLAGTAGAIVAGRLMKSILVGVSGQDPWTIFASAGLLLAVSAIACYFPARKAVGVDPGTALRQD